MQTFGVTGVGGGVIDSFGALSISEPVQKPTIQSKFTLRSINVAQLDKQYCINNLFDIGLDSFQAQDTDTVTKVTTSLEVMGWSKTRLKPHDTIMINDDLSLRLFVTPSAPLQSSQKRAVCCWYCRHTLPMEWYPVGIPLRYKTVDNTFDCEGVFCSFNCCIAFLQEHYDYRYKDSSVLLLMMYRKMNAKNSGGGDEGKKLTNIIPSPSWKLLKEYGGHLTIDEYRKCIQQFVEYKSMMQLCNLHTNSELFVETP